MINCNRLCKQYANETLCTYCKNNYIVSENFYKAKRIVNNLFVSGYLVKNKYSNQIIGIMNKSTCFAELAWIDESTLEEIKKEDV